MKRLTILSLAVYLSLLAQGQNTTRPWTFWYWMYGAVSEEGIRADLKAMKDVGLGGCYLMPIRGAAERPEYGGKADALSDNFWRMVDLSLTQADSLGLDMGIHVCDGFALAGGPWISPAESMQKVVWSDTLITVTGKGTKAILPSAVKGYQGYYEDIATFAVQAESPLPQPQFTGTIVRDDKGTFRSKEPGYIQATFEKPQTVRSLDIIPSGNNIQAQRLLVQASEDGINFRDIRQLTPPRQGWQNTDQNYTYSLPETTARHFRFYWTPEGTPPGSEDLDAAKWSPILKIKDLRLSAEPRIDQYEAKNGSIWRIAQEYQPTASLPQIIRVTPQTVLPKGLWRIIRFGHTSTGHTNATAGGAKGLECDKFSPQAVSKQIDSWFGLFMKRPNHRAIKYLHVDSWECGSQNWGHNFAQEFKQRRGYDIIPLLPVYAGIPMQDSEKILRDIRYTINELINEVFFATAKKKAEEFGVKLSSESVAPTMVSDGIEHYKYVDVPMGEFWLNSPTHDKPNDMLDAISGAHVYGKQIVQAEGFTEVRGVWDETPASIKPLLDRNFCLGMNRLFFHVNTHNPWLDRKPGMTLDGIGLFFQRDQTWFPEAKAFVDYITRCQTLLQRGKPVVDIAVYTGEEMPSRALTPDRLVPMLPGLFGKEREASEKKRLANVGQPMEESPVGVRHSAGILDLKDWINPMHGYQYDSMNKDALLTQPFNYKVLVIPESLSLSETVKERLAELSKQGIQILTKPYEENSIKNLPPDIVLPEGVAFTHRTMAEGDIYFLSNQTAKELSFEPTFRSKVDETIIYDPISDSSLPYKGTIKLAPYGSCFVVLGTRIYSQGGNTTFPRWEQSIPKVGIKCPLTGNESPSWDIDFKESGVTLKNQQLFDWSQHSDDKIRYFSGHARYTSTIKMKSKQVPQGRVWLSLPNVKDIAHVWINGKDCGIIWTAPYKADITGTLKKGENRIEIEVVNTWHNALRGMDQGKAPYEGIWTNAKYRTKGEELLPAGLIVQPEIIIEK